MRRTKAARPQAADLPAGLETLAGTNQTYVSALTFDPATTLIRMPEVEALVGLARPTIYKLMRNPESGFPAPVPLSTSTARGAPVAWVLGEIQEWIRARIAARVSKPLRHGHAPQTKGLEGAA